MSDIYDIALLQDKHNNAQERFTISDVAADWHELMIPQRSMRPSIARAGEQLDPRCSIPHTTAPINYHLTAFIP